MLEVKLKIKKKKEYLLFVLPTFLGGLILYTIIANSAIKYGFNSPLPAIGYGVMGGYLFASIVSGILLFVRFIREKPLWLKISCAVLFLPLFMVLYFVGAITLISYFVFNVLTLISNSKKLKGMEAEKVKPVLKGEMIEKLMQEEIRNVKYEEIEDELKQYKKSCDKLFIIGRGLVIVGFVMCFIQQGIILGLIGLVIIGIGMSYSEDKNLCIYMKKKDNFSTGVFYIGYDEEVFGIFHGSRGLERKSLGKYHMMGNAKMNGINRFIVNRDRKMIIVFDKQ